MNFELWPLGLLALLALVILARVKRSRDARRERKLDFSKCYHNAPHEFDCSQYEDIYCCDVCGRPSDDVIHKTK